VSVPEEVRDRLKSQLWAIADQVGWANLSTIQKSKYYEDWTRNHEIGGLLARFIDRERVRLYIKDTLLKSYALDRFSDPSRSFRVSGIEASAKTVETYQKPHGRRLEDGRIICWGRAEDWKSILMALHERSFICKGTRPFAAILTNADGRFTECAFRHMIQTAAEKLAIEKLIWLDT
jgi:hypothetical protein